MYYKTLPQRTAARTSIVLLAFFLIQGCAAPAPKVSSNLSATGIFLQPDPDNPGLLWWESPGFNWHHYHSIFLAPVAVDLSSDDQHPLSPETLKQFVNEFRLTLGEILSPEYLLTKERGPGVLEIKVTLTELKTANPAINLATTLAVFVPLDMGGAAIQAEFFDAGTGRRVAAMADRKTGTPLQLVSGFSRLGHARAAVNEWAKELKNALAVNP